MKRLLYILVLLPLGINAQNMYNVSSLFGNDLTGTARYVGMGGSMSALGADMSTMGTNPAGMAMYRSNDVSITAAVDVKTNRADYEGSLVESGNTNAFIGNAAMVCAIEVDDEYLKYFNFGLGYRQKNNLAGAFEMYANLKTYSFFELQHALSAVVVETPKEKADRLFDLLLKSVNEKSAVQRQYVLYTWGMLEQDSSKKQFLLREALYQTQPDFHITYIQDSVLTFQEMMILIYIAKSLKNDTTKSILILYKLMEYFQVWNYENLEKVRIQKEINCCITISRYSLSFRPNLMQLIRITLILSI